MADGGVVSGPALYAMLGAGAGAMLDKKDPLRGAALGGMGGYFGGPMLSSMGAPAAGTGLTAGAGEASLLGVGGTSSGAGLGLKAGADASLLGVGGASAGQGLNAGYLSSLPAAGNGWSLAGGAAAPSMGFDKALQLGGMGNSLMSKNNQPKFQQATPQPMPVFPQGGQSVSFADLSPYQIEHKLTPQQMEQLRRQRGY